MTSTPIVDEVTRQMQNLPEDLQRRVLAFVHTLRSSTQQGVPGRQLLPFAGSIPQDDLELIQQAIEAGCEQVDLGEW